MANINEIQQANYETLVFLDGLCKENDIKYVMCAGTFLGAIRHKGFIPWDDDVDILMSVSEFRKLEKCFKSDKYFLQTPETDLQDPYIMYKIRINGTEMKEDVFSRLPIHHGVWIDIFLYTDAGKGAFAKKLQVFFNAVLTTYRCRYWHTSENHPKIIYKILSKLPRRIALFIDRTTLGTICFLGSKKSSDYFCISVTKAEFKNKSYLDDTSLYQFEQSEFPGPKDYDAFLRQQYGDDYMTPKQWSHFSDYSQVEL